MSIVNAPSGRASSIASSPIHRIIASASVKYAYTSSGSASTNTDAVTGSASTLPRSDLGPQALKGFGPKLGHEPSDRLEALGTDDVETALALGLHGHQAGIPQDLQVLGHRLLADVEVGRDLVHRARPVPDQQQHRTATRLGQGCERGLRTHARRISSLALYKCLLVGSTGRVRTRGGGMSADVREIVTEYVRAVGDRRFDRFEELLHPEVEFGGGTVAGLQGASVVAEGYRRLGPIILRNDIRELVVDGDRAAVLYDFVTDTEAKAVLTAAFDRAIGNGRARRWPTTPRTGWPATRPPR